MADVEAAPQQEVPAPAEGAAPAGQQEVCVQPSNIQLPAGGGALTLQLQNNNPTGRYSFKVKSTNNIHYRVNPVFGFVEPGGGAQLEVTRLNGPPKSDDRLEILFLTVDGAVTDPKAPFAGGTVQEFSRELPMVAE